MKQTITVAGLINQIEMKYKKGRAGCSAEAMLSPIVNQWGLCVRFDIWAYVRYTFFGLKKKRRYQGLQKEQRQSIMCGEIEILEVGLAHCVSYWVYSSSWAAWSSMEEIKAWQNTAKIGLEEQRNWQVNRGTRLPKNVSNQGYLFFGFQNGASWRHEIQGR